MKKTILLAASVFAAMSVWAESTVVDGVTWYYNLEYSGSSTYVGGKWVYSTITNAAIISGADKYAGKLTIPSSLDGYTVTRIGDAAFYECSGLTDITIPNTVVDIYGCAFYGCTGLTGVVLPDSVASLGGSCFYNCSALKSVKLSSQLTELPGECFRACSSLTSIELPEGLTSIGERTFSGCTSLADVNLPTGLTSIGYQAFYNCKSFTRLDIPSTVESIGTHMIRGCDKLKTITVASGNVNCKVVNNCLVSKSGSTLLAVPFGCEEVDIPVGVTAIPDEMFRGDDNLIRVTIPVGVASIGQYAFFDCDSLQAVEIPEGCTMIGSYAFSGCDTLTQVSLPEGLTTIRNDAFNSCKLTEVILPASLTSIGSYAFGNGNYSTRKVVFLGAPQSGVANSCLLLAKDISYPREYGAQWLAILNDVSKFNGYNQPGKPEVEYVSVAVRAIDPTILDCVYKVNSAQPTVKVRALVFQDGERSFAKVVRPASFIEGTATNIGDAVTANVEHKLTWQVSADWAIDLAKVKFEVLAMEEDLLPLELTTIPANGTNTAMEISWNAINESQVFDALLWLYADKSAGLKLTDGCLYYNDRIVANGTTVYSGKSATARIRVNNVYAYYANGIDVVYEKMGFGTLAGDTLTYANDCTRLGLTPSGVRQYAYRWIEK